MENNSADQKLESLGLKLPPAPEPVGVYKPCLIDGKYLFVSGHGPFRDDRSLMTGRVDEGVDMDQGKAAAKQVGLTILSTIKATLGSLDKVKRVIKVLGMVNCAPSFKDHPYVINGCSELFAQVWGEENGIGCRSAVGVGSLPHDITVEIEAMFELVEENKQP